MNSTHTIRSSVVAVFSVKASSENGLARLNASHSCVTRCQDADSGGVVAAAVLVARSDYSSVFVFAFPTGSERILERAVIDPFSVALPASFSFAQDSVGLPFVFGCCSKKFSKLDCVQTYNSQRSNQPWMRANQQSFQNNSPDDEMMEASKKLLALTVQFTVTALVVQKDVSLTLCFVLQLTGCRGRSH